MYEENTAIDEKKSFKAKADTFDTLGQVTKAIKDVGVQKCGVIFGIDYTISNRVQGRQTFNGLSLHDLSGQRNNPYQEVICILGETLEPFDDDGIIPAFGFGDRTVKDLGIFPLKTDGECDGFQEVLDEYNRITPTIKLGGPTSFVPIIEEAINIVKRTKQYTFEDVYTYESLMVPWYFVAGNHDHHGNVSAQIAYSSRSTRWNFPNYYYPLTFSIPGGKTVQIVMVDTVMLCGNTKGDEYGLQPEGPGDVQGSENQWEWIETQLQTSTADYLLAAGHFPVYSIAEHGPTKCLTSRLQPMLIKYRVTAYLCGHDHNIQHLTVTEQGQTVDYVVSGAADKIDDSTKHKNDVPNGSLKFHWAEIKNLGGFAFMDATSSNMTFTFVDGTNNPLYQHTLFPRK